MTTDPFSSFDINRYTTVSNLPLQTIVSMSKALLAAKPDKAPVHVDQIMDRLQEATAEAEAAMIVRLREDNESSASADQVLDIAVDPLWSLLRRRLADWSVFERVGLDFLAHDLDAPQVVDLEVLRDKAGRARAIAERLFGAGGLGFVQRPYAEQAQLMANVLGLIDADELEDAIVELTGAELLPAIRRCQVRYEAMVRARAMRLGGPAADLRVLRGRVRRLIVRYAGAVITMLDDSEPHTLEVVETALVPMLTIRSTATREVAESEVDTEIVPAVVDDGDVVVEAAG